ncbi:cation diffusion facilitator family transporter [Robiginitalea sp.]|uniref:cation diffusion facilitator family transporter n=1 Tax=Robiginitalea sp. TaxID=1902411 RepID=UPI003C72B39E
MAHSHSHHDHHSPHPKGKNLLISIILNVVITLAQVVGGIISGSLALLSDAVHNLSDVFSLIISYVASSLSQKQASTNKTFGYKRAEIIAAFVNSASLIIVAAFLIKEAIERFFNPQDVGTGIVIALSVLGILVNGFSVLLLKSDSERNMNMRSAYLHLFTDMLASVAVLAGGLLMYFFGWYWIDPLLTLIIALYLIYMGYHLLKTSTRVLMLFTPETIEVQQIVKAICTLGPIENVHHVHIWQLNEDEVHMEAHIDFKQDIPLSEFDKILVQIEELVFTEFGINHINIQPEFEKCDSKNLIVQD